MSTENTPASPPAPPPTETPPASILTTKTEVNPNALPPVEEFKPDTTKTEAENAAAKVEFDKKAAETKAAKDAADAEAAKDKVSKDNPFKVEEIKLPDGFTVDETTSKGFVDLVNKHGISRTAAAEFVKLQADLMKAASEKGDKQWTDLQEQWAKEVKADPEIGGDKLEPAVGAIAKIFDKYGSKELRSAFDLTGAGNNPHVIKFLAKIAKDLNEPGPGPSPSPNASEISLAQKMYPNQGKAA